MAIYGLYEGIEGNVTAADYPNHFQVQSLHFGTSRGISMEPGNLGNRESTRPSLSEITITKLADNSVTSLFQYAVGGGPGGTAGKTVEFKFVQTGSDKPVEYMKITLTDALISSYSVSADSDGAPVETICLSYSQIDVWFDDYDTNNSTSNPISVGYSLKDAKAI